MKNLKSYILIAMVAVLFSSCAKNLSVNFQTNSENTGSIVIALTAPLKGSVLTVDDKLLVDKEFVKKITIKNVPVGDHDVNFSSDSWQYQTNVNEKFKIKTEKEKESAKIVTRPPYSTGYYVLWGGEIIADIIFIIFVLPHN